MTLVYCVMLNDESFLTKVIENVDFFNIGRKCLSYRLKGQSQWIHTLTYDSVRRIRIYEDGSYVSKD